MKLLTLVFTLSLIPLTSSYAMEICSGPNRAARKVTCLVDGDTGWEKGKKWRLQHIDTPELSRPQCRQEKQKGEAALHRLSELMAPGYTLQYSGNKDRTSDRRDLVTVRLSDGRDAGQVLIKEGLAQPWPNTGNVWCDH